jgi:hypothetical protein
MLRTLKDEVAPMRKLNIFVKEVMVIETAASAYVSSTLLSTMCAASVFLHDASIKNVSSIPIPENL